MRKSDLDGAATITFSKLSGPDWLTVATNGTLSGIPNGPDVGEDLFTVGVMDAGGLTDTAAMNVNVANVYSGVRGVEDLLGLAAQWLRVDCEDFPACGGADLNKKMELPDLAILAENWLRT